MSTLSVCWGILGCGGIAGAFAEGLATSTTGRLAAVASRDADKARAFGARFGVAEASCHGNYADLLRDDSVQVVYIATPHPAHAKWAVLAAEAGKHILCEKPLTLNHADAMAVALAAREHGVFLMEAFMYRCHPQTARVVELVRSGAIGDVRTIQATFSFRAGFHKDSRLFNNRLGGGGVLDVGCYPVSFARLIAGAAAGLPFEDPDDVQGTGTLHPETGVDECAAAVLRFPSGIVAQVATGIAVNQDNSARIFGTEGWIHVPDPWVPARKGGTVAFTVHRQGKPAETVETTTGTFLYGLEADAVGRALAAGLREAPEMPVADTLGNLRTLDRWRASFHFEYAAERLDGGWPTVTGRRLRRRRGAPIPRAAIDGLDKPVSRLVLGCDNQRNLPHASVMLDAFFERGGNTFDTAFIYGGGWQERLLGQWIRNRGVRQDVAVIVKGAHTPHCNPEELERQLLVSLERLQLERADIYIMHRDNPDVPAGEFVDVLDRLCRKGKIGVFGGSNWSIPRFMAANAHAKLRRRRPFRILSNNLSLARMVNPVWPGCVAASDPQSRAWLAKHQVPLFAWSSQARGFFTERAGPDKLGDHELAHGWYADDNWARRDRAFELARQRGVQPINIALAYVLAQPFPTFPLIGPRTLDELVSSLAALDVKLTPDDLRWLNLEVER